MRLSARHVQLQHAKSVIHTTAWDAEACRGSWMPGPNSNETPCLNAPNTPPIGVFQYYLILLDVHIHTEIRWMLGVTVPFTPSLQATAGWSSNFKLFFPPKSAVVKNNGGIVAISGDNESNRFNPWPITRAFNMAEAFPFPLHAVVCRPVSYHVKIINSFRIFTFFIYWILGIFL